MTGPAAQQQRTLVVGTRGSALARAQAAMVIGALEQHDVAGGARLEIVATRGDRDQAAPLSIIGGQGAFTKELQLALLDGSIDLAVHSLKDLPPVETPGLRISAFLARDDPRDVLVSRTGAPLAELPAGSRLGTGSARRRAFLQNLRPDLDVRNIRGNVDTRLRKVKAGEFDAVVLAAAGLARLGRTAEAAEVFATGVIIPAPGQGILAVETRTDDAFAAERVVMLDDPLTRVCALAERGFLRRLGGGCQRPAAAYASADGATIGILGALAAEDGTGLARRTVRGPAHAASILGASLAASLLAAR